MIIQMARPRRPEVIGYPIPGPQPPQPRRISNCTSTLMRALVQFFRVVMDAKSAL
jgi:hypothetical protein